MLMLGEGGVRAMTASLAESGTRSEATVSRQSLRAAFFRAFLPNVE